MDDDDDVLDIPLELGTYLSYTVRGVRWVRQDDIMAMMDRLLITLVDLKADERSRGFRATLDGQIQLASAIQNTFDPAHHDVSIRDPFLESTAPPSSAPRFGLLRLWRWMLRDLFGRGGG